MRSINPATGETLERYDEHPWQEVLERLERAHRTFLEWRSTPVGLRADRMRKVAALLRDRRQRYAELMAREMGKPVVQGRNECDKCAWACDHYADNAEQMLARQSISTDATRSYVSYQPLGVVLAIMPWNFPFWQVFRFAAPALMAGNTAVLKHASNVSGASLALEQIFRDAGFPGGVFTSVLAGTGRVSAILENPRVAAVTLTGSVAAGQAVGKQAGSLVKKSVLELGGSDAYVVLEDADLEPTVETCVASRLINSGQSCIAAKRFIVVEKLRQRFERLFVERMQRVRVGDPLREDTEVGPQAREDLRDKLHQQVRQSIAEGAKLLLGGSVPQQPGAWYPPTVLTDVDRGMPAYEEELFGPVAAIIPARDEETAIRIANDSCFGLGAAVFTRDLRRGEEIAEQRIAAGSCFVNTDVRSDPRLPFGGIKASGYGRELAEFGIREFVNVKTVYIA